MRRHGRPLRFLGATLGGWAALRTAMLWPTLEAARDLIHAAATPVLAATAPPPSMSPRVAAPGRVAAAIAPARVTHAASAAAPPRPATEQEASRIALALASMVNFGRAMPTDEDGAIPAPLRPTPAAPARRLTGSAWGIVREGVRAGLPGGQLGGSQAGVRIAYALGARHRVALAARVSAPIDGRGAEAAFGVELRPPRLPLRLIAERRVAIDDGRGGTAVYAVGGTAPVPVAAGFRVEGYAQGGVVFRDGAQGFADGAARLTRPVTRTLDIGVGAWGGVQPGVARVDVGPTIGVALPVARRRVRLSLDWRQRIAGDARPGSGPALSIGTDF